MEKVNERVERLRAKAGFFFKNHTKTFVKIFSGEYYFCEILMMNEHYLFILNFEGRRKGEKNRLLWLDVEDIEEYEGDEGDD